MIEIENNSGIPIRFVIFNGKDETSTMYSVREFGNTCLLMSLDKVLEYGGVLNVPQADERERKVERKEIPLFDEEHISERTGRGVPKITEIYGKETYEFRENSIVVSIPFTRVSTEEIPPVIFSVDEKMQKILAFCTEPKSTLEIANMLGYTDKKTVRRYINPLLEQGRLAMTIPNKANSRNQKYITVAQ